MSGSTTVPTMDAFNAVVSKVDALNTRVTALEHGTPPVPPNPVKPPSADGTTVTNTTGEIVDGKHRTFKLTGPASNYQISTDGKVSGGMVARLYAKGQLCYQENVNHDWWVMPLAATTHSDDDWVGCPNPTGVAPPPPPPPPPGPIAGVPKPAADVGFTMRTHGPAIQPGVNWTVTQSTAKQNSDGSVTLTEDAYHYNENLCSAGAAGGNLRGVAFGGGGYFEVDMKIANPILGSGGDPTGWPAWWANGAEGTYSDVPNPLPDQQGIEYDAVELLGPGVVDYNAGIILWDGNGHSWNNTQAGQHNGVVLPSGFDWNVRRKYAWLWVPATSTTKGYIKNYRDGAQVGRTYTWDLYNGSGWQQSANNNPWAVLDKLHMRLLIGSNARNPMTVYSITVWQKDDSKNLRRGVPLPA